MKYFCECRGLCSIKIELPEEVYKAILDSGFYLRSDDCPTSTGADILIEQREGYSIWKEVEE